MDLWVVGKLRIRNLVPRNVRELHFFILGMSLMAIILSLTMILGK